MQAAPKEKGSPGRNTGRKKTMDITELEDVYSENDKYLIREYQKHGTDDFLVAGLGDKTFVVPYKYTVGSHTPKTSISRFMASLLDFEVREEGKYLRAGEPVLTVGFEGREYVVPYGMTGRISPEQLAETVQARAEAKYNTVINAARALEAAGHDTGMLDFSSAAAEKYAYRLAELGSTAVLDKETPERLKVMDFLHKAGNKAAKKFKASAQGMARQLGRKVVEAERQAARIYVPKSYKAAALATLLGAGTAGVMLTGRGCSDTERQEQQTEVSAETATYMDFMGREHSDVYGNIRRIQDWKPEITALLMAVEGFSDKAFPDGGGVPTIGSGTTFYLDENGRETKVKMGDEISADEAMEHKWRYINKYMIETLGDDFGRACTEKEAMAGIGAGFCWGQNAFAKSEFLKSMKKGEDLDEQLRKLSGFRRQKGLLKRSYALACCLSGAWTAQDLLDLPVYEIKGKGYVHCAVYTLDLHEIMPCRSDGKGGYAKDKDGNDVPKVGEDGFCLDFYLDKAQDIKESLIAQAERGKTPYKTVRDLMPEDMLRQLEPERFGGFTAESEQCRDSSIGAEKNGKGRTLVTDARAFKWGRD